MFKFSMTSSWSSSHSKQCIYRAKDGSVVDLATIAPNMDMVSDSHLDEFLKIFITRLKVPEGFNPLLPLPVILRPQYEEVQQCLMGLANARQRICARNDRLSAVQLSWPSISKWAQFYYFDKCSNVAANEDTFPTQDELLAQTIITSLFEMLSATKGAYSQLVHQDGTFGLLAKAWLAVIPNENLDKSVRASIMDSMELALQGAIAPPFSLSTARKEIIKASAVVDVVLSSLTKLPENKSEDKLPGMKFILHTVNVLDLLLYPGCHKCDFSVFYKPLLEERVIHIVVKTLLQLASPSVSNLEYAEKISIGCLRVITSLLGSGSAYTQVSRMLDLGLLDGVVKFISTFYPGGKSPDFSSAWLLKNLVGNLLSNNLFYYAALSSAIKAVNQLIRTRTLQVLETSFLREEWAFFHSLLLERAAGKALYDLKIETKPIPVCHFCGKQNLATRKDLMACAKCRIAFYCSRECQKGGWDHKGHSIECDVLTESHQEKRFSRNSFYFLPYLVAMDVRRHMSGIRKLLASSPEFRNVKAEDVGYAVSYVNVKEEPVLEISPFCTLGMADAVRTKAGGGVVKKRPHSRSGKLDQALERALETEEETKDIRIVHSTVYRGGARATLTFHGVSKSYLKMPAFPAGAIEGPSAPDGTKWCRRKARDDRGREIAAEWDPIDDIVSRALDKTIQTDDVETLAAVAPTVSDVEMADADSSDAEESQETKETVFERIVRFAKEYEDDSDGIVGHITPRYDSIS
ncbi:hypothetical protein SCHPADRAFT_994277 [Schizopora paradoxa]|uniref:MYND-type domain-containing protein n=1 Tax=Schizopora paradoxa TaxID=27342 RepID=A0A0H2S7G6_9AGAM|nr:hypothetical protein SCHPADRAFT_994277 [Schizopora paradoxa]